MTSKDDVAVMDRPQSGPPPTETLGTERPQTLAGKPEISVVVPVHNEAANVGNLADEIAARLNGRAYEMIFVDDSSIDETRAKLFELKAKYPALRVLGHRKNAGQSRAVRTGVHAARADIVVTLDGDGQNDPGDITGLVAQILRADAPGNLGLVQGLREKRQDSGWKRMGSKWANRVRKSLLKDGNSDSGCGVRAFRRDAFMAIPYFDHMHRYLPALMIAEGYLVESRPVNHRSRQHGKSNYTNFGRLADAVSDLRGVMWLRKRRRSPGGVDEY